MNSSNVDLPPSSDPVQIFGDIEAEASGLAFGAMVFTVKPGCSTEPHSHGSEEMWLIREGSGRATINGQQMDLTVGDRVTVSPGNLHGIVNTSEGNLKVMAFWWRDADHGQ